MSATSVRCYKCGKRIRSIVRICPACGAEQPLHVSRVRCGYCGRRIPADVPLCPVCYHNPRGFYLRPRHLAYLVALAVLASLLYAGMNAPVWFRSLATVGNLTTAASATPTKTPPIVIVTATAQRVAAVMPTETATLVPSPLATSAPPQPTLTGTARPTRTRTPLPTATRRPSVVPPAPTATMTAVLLAPPVLVSPQDRQSLYGPHSRITLAFHGTSPLGPADWFRVQVDFKDRAGNPWTWCGWSRSNTIEFPFDYYDESWQLDRTFRWHVNLAQPASDRPSTCAADVMNMSVPSSEWTFFWY